MRNVCLLFNCQSFIASYYLGIYYFFTKMKEFSFPLEFDLDVIHVLEILEIRSKSSFIFDV